MVRRFKDIFRSKDDTPLIVPKQEKPKRDSLINFVNEKKQNQ